MMVIPLFWARFFTILGLSGILVGVLLIIPLNKAKRLRFQSPLFLKSDIPKLNSPKSLNPNKIHSRLKYDGVLWEDGGVLPFSGGELKVIGPLCPKDLTPLGIIHRDKIDMYLRWDTLISGSDYHSQLICPECRRKYTLGRKSKVLSDSRDEVENCFKGKRNREQGS